MINQLKWLGGSACLSTLLLAQPLYANENDELRQRLNELESIVIDMEAKMGGKAVANSFSSENFDIGGYYHGVAREFDTDGGSAAGFARNLMYLRIEADVSEKWAVSFGNLFGQVDLEQPELASLASLTTDTDGDQIPDYFDNYNADTSSLIGVSASQSPSYNQLFNTANGSVKNLETFSLNVPVDINVKYQHNDALKFTFGRQRIPLGQFSLYPMSWRHTEIPRYMLGTNGVSNLFNPFIQGISLSGQFFPNDGEHILNYSAFAADTTISGGGLRGVNNNEQAGFRLGYARPDQSFSFGLNAIQGKREDFTLYGGNRFTALGFDALINMGGFRLLAEYYDSDEGNANIPDKTGFSLRPSYLITPKIELIAIHDVMDAPIYQIENVGVSPLVANGLPEAVLSQFGISSTVNAPSHLGKLVENVVGINYKPVDNIRLRLTHSLRTYEDFNDYEVKITSFSATASF
jgi:hypothetical protein